MTTSTTQICKHCEKNTSWWHWYHWLYQCIILLPFWTHPCKNSQHMEEGAPHQLHHHPWWHQTSEPEEPTLLVDTLSIPKVLIVFSTLLQKFLCWCGTRNYLLCQMLWQSSYCSCWCWSRADLLLAAECCPKCFSTSCCFLTFVKKLKNSVVKESRLTTTMSQWPKIFGPNHPMDHSFHLLSLRQLQNIQYKRNIENSPGRKLDGWVSLTSTRWPPKKNLWLKWSFLQQTHALTSLSPFENGMFGLDANSSWHVLKEFKTGRIGGWWYQSPQGSKKATS